MKHTHIANLLSGLFSLFLLASTLVACTPQASGPSQPVTSQTPPSTTTTSSTPQVTGSSSQADPWTKVVSEAQKEGRVVVYSSQATGPQWDRVKQVFENRYNVKLEGIAGGRADVVRERMKVEQRTGQLVGDITLGGATSAVAMAQEGWFISLSDLPALQDKGVFLKDPAYETSSQVVIYAIAPPFIPFVNTKLVQPQDEPKTWNDLLQPRWKGQIVMDDPTVAGGGSQWMGYSLVYKIIDMEFMQQLSRQNVLIGRSYVEELTSVAQGEKAISLGVGSYNAVPFVVKGAPIKGADLKDTVVTTFYTMSTPKKQAHPNATKLFANWLLTPEGQTAWSHEMQWWPIRKEVPPATHAAVVFKNYTKLIIPTLEDDIQVTKYITDGTFAKVFKK